MLWIQAGQRPQPEGVEHVDQHVFGVLLVALRDRPSVVAQAAVALDQPPVARAVVAHPSEHPVVLGRVVQARLVRVDDRQQAVAIDVSLPGQPVVVQSQLGQTFGGKRGLVG